MSLRNFIARQPIFDRRQEVVGYELLHRSDGGDAFAGGDPDRATLEVLNGSLLIDRFQDLTGGKPGFINVPGNMLVQDFLQILPPELTVIEVLETVLPCPSTLAALKRLKAAGYTIALDDYSGDPALDPFLPLADIVKVDVLATPPEMRQQIAEMRGSGTYQLLAEKVEQREDLDEALALGYELFQGFFFCKPETTARRDIPLSKVNQLEFLREVTQTELEFDRLEDLILREVALATKLLRFLDSSQFGVREEITTIRQALNHLGERPLRRWGALVALSGLGEDKPLELLRTCLVRARFCESLARESGIEGMELELYLTGMFSVLDALLDQPLEVALGALGLNDTIGAALRGDGTTAAVAFELCIACERGDWSGYERHCAHLGLDPTGIAELYSQALLSADQTFGEPLPSP